MVKEPKTTGSKSFWQSKVFFIGIGVFLCLFLAGFFIDENPRLRQSIRSIPIAHSLGRLILHGLSQPTALKPNPTTEVSPTQTVLSTANKVSPIDGMVMVYIPAGEFYMGEPDEGNSSPLHKVSLDAYWIDQTDVTNAMYAKCVQGKKCALPVYSDQPESHFTNPAYSNHPVVFVTWYDAMNYCQWAGRRLPTEAEWEKAARGVDWRKFPWGETSPNKSLLNYSNIISDTTSVGAYPLGSSPYGVLDMAGNVRQWIADWFDANYYRQSPSYNPQGPATGDKRVLRGGSFMDIAYGVRVTRRFEHQPDSPGINRGFRCAAFP